MNRRAVFAIARKDLHASLQSKAVTIPMIIVPLIIAVVMPLVFGLILRMAGDAAANQDIQDLLEIIPPALAGRFAGMDEQQAVLTYSLLYFFAPLYLLLPVMVSNVMAADSFAGEKERKTLEALLYTPTSDRELLWAKLLGAWIPGVAVGLLSFFAYCIVVDIVAWPVVERILLPNLLWLIIAFWVGPAAAALGLGAAVLVSARVGTFQEAYQLGSLIVLPFVMLLLAQIAGVLFFSIWFALLLGLILWSVDLVLFWAGARTLKRDVLASRL